MVVKKGGEPREILFHDEAKARRNENKRKPGRPRTTDGAQHHVGVTIKRLRIWLALVDAVLEKPRSATARGALRGLHREITERLGPAADPAWQPREHGTPRTVYHYRLTDPDGDRWTVRTIEEAAEWYGVGVPTMRAYMSKHGGKCQKVAWSGNAAGWKIVEKVALGLDEEVDMATGQGVSKEV